MTHYDYIFAGGGLAGLSLACQMARSPLRGRSMLIIDRDSKQRDDRTFSFWTDEDTPFQAVVSQSWNQLGFYAPGLSQVLNLENYRYQTIRGLDFYRQAHAELDACPGVTFLNGNINQLHDWENGVEICVDGQVYTGRWAFDSRLQPARISHRERTNSLHMAFVGWDIETKAAAFDPQTATLMDFRTRANNDVRFFYVLPNTRRKALVEFTLFTRCTLLRQAAEAALQRYLGAAYGMRPGRDYQANHREAGSLLISDQGFSRRLGEHTLAIGIRGGQLKPSTGYAFTRIQKDTRAILRSLLQHDHPFDLPGNSLLYSQMDSIMLEVMRRHPTQIPNLFSCMFSQNPIERIFRFLDEEASLTEIQQLIASLPPGLFLSILARRSLAPQGFLERLLAGD